VGGVGLRPTACIMLPSSPPRIPGRGSMPQRPFTERDIAAGIAQLRNQKVAGPDGWTAEFLRHACTEQEGVRGMIVRTSLLNCILAETYPSRAWVFPIPHVGALIPGPKPKRRPDLMDVYRGIAVGRLRAKPFANVFPSRLDRWAEAGGMGSRPVRILSTEGHT
jgi:hypothetical protein